MRLMLYAILASLAITSTASGAGGAWTTRKAASNVRAEAVVRLPTVLETSLAAELEDLEYRWLILEATANQQDLEEGTLGVMGGVAHNARYRVSTVLKQVRGGLPVSEATCAGMGKPRAGRFGRFRCAVVSARLEVPTLEAVWESDRITGVRYGAARLLGPFHARVDVRTAGASPSFRHVGDSSPAG